MRGKISFLPCPLLFSAHESVPFWFLLREEFQIIQEFAQKAFVSFSICGELKA